MGVWGGTNECRADKNNEFYINVDSNEGRFEKITYFYAHNDHRKLFCSKFPEEKQRQNKWIRNYETET